MSRVYVQCGWDSVPHLSADAKRELFASIPPYQRAARSQGEPQLGAGAIYPIPESDIVVDPFDIPPYWRRAYGLDVGWNRTAAIWGAYDQDADILYWTGEYERSMAEPSVHAGAIRMRGEWCPGVIDPASRGRGQKDGAQLLQDYVDLGLKLSIANNAVEHGLFNVFQRMSTGRLKIFKNLVGTLRELRIYRRDEKGHVVKKDDHLMDAGRYLTVSGIDLAVMPPNAGEMYSRQFNRTRPQAAADFNPFA